MSFASVVSWSLRRRFLVVALSLVALAAGLAQGLQAPVDVLPELTRPTVTIQAEAPRLAAPEIETQVAWPIESAVLGVPGVTRVRSTSVAGLALVIAEFGWGTEPYRNRQLVAERLDAVRSQLPADVQPRLAPLASLMGEILLVGLSQDGDPPGLRALRSHADWTLRPALLGIAGVSQVTVIGGEVAQWEVRPNADRLRLMDLRVADLDAALRGYGLDLGGGIAEADGHDRTVRALASPFSVAELRETAIAGRGAAPFPRLSQVADVVEGAKVRRGSAGVDGHPAVLLAIQKQPGADTLQVTRDVERRLAALDGALPAGARRTVVFRQADFIRAAIGNVREALAWGAAIVALVLVSFLAGGSAALIPVVAIPISMAAAFLALQALGLTLNTLTLGGLAIAVGELVDDAVVGVENVIRRLREGRDESGSIPFARVADATVEVRSGILLATLLIACGFVPLFALEGIEGRLFSSLGVAYVAAILASLVVAATLTPVLCALLLANGRAPAERRWLVRIQDRYAELLARALAYPRPWLASCAGLLAVVLVAAAFLPRAFLPAFDESTLTVNLVLSPGIALSESERAGAAAERLLLELPDVASVGRRTGRAELDEHAEGVHYSELDVVLKPRARPRAALVGAIRERLAILPGQVTVGTPIAHRLDHLLSGVRAPFAAKIFGEDPATLARIAGEVRDALRGIPGLSEAGFEAQASLPESRVRVDAVRAAAYGASAARVLEDVSSLSGGLPLSRLVDGERRIDLVLRAAPEVRDPAQLASMPVDTPAGAVPLSWLADVKVEDGPDRIGREDGRRRQVVSAFGTGADFDAAAAEAEARIARIAMPPGYEIRVEGERTARREATLRLAIGGLLALGLMLALLHGRYGSLRLDLIVLANIPLSWIGGAIALLLTGTPLSMASLVGFVTLSGVAARNGILKIDRYRRLAQESGSFDAALAVRGARERFAPVAMTAVAAAAALLPLLVAGDAPGKEILHPVALVTFGGLFASTLLDAFVTPMLVLATARRDLLRAEHEALVSD